MLHAVPSYIKYPQDIGLLNDARLHAEKIIDEVCKENNIKKPRTYRRRARKDYLSIAKRKKKSKKIIRKAIRKQLSYVTQDVRYIKEMQKSGIELNEKQTRNFDIIERILEQQQYMYDNKIHRVPERIVVSTSLTSGLLSVGKLKLLLSLGLSWI